MKSKYLLPSRPCAILRWLPAAVLLCFAPAIHARADGPIINCSALDIDFADSGAKKECRKAESSSGTAVASLQSLVATGAGYALVFIRTKAGHNSYVATQEATAIAKALGPYMLLGSAPIVSSHDPVNGFEIATFTGMLSGGGQSQLTCFAFGRYQGTVVARGGYEGAPGYSTEYIGAYCAGAPDANSDSNISNILSKLHLPSD